MRSRLRGLGLAALLATAGCLHPAVERGDQAAQAGDSRAALDAYKSALQSGELVAGEVDSVRDKMRDAAALAGAKELGELEAKPKDEANVLAIARLRHELAQVGVAGALIARATEALEKAALGAWGSVEQEVQQKRFVSAMRRADILVGALPADSQARARARLVAEAGAKYHADLAARAEGQPGAVQLHAGIAERMTGTPSPSRSAASALVRLEAEPTWNVTRSGPCGQDAAKLGGASGGAGKETIEVLVSVTRCEPKQDVSSQSEPFTYTASEQYTESESYTEYVEERVQTGENCSTSTGYTMKGGTPQSTCTPVYTTKRTPVQKTRQVTKTRQVQRQTTRTITSERYAFALRGNASYRWPNGALDVPFEADIALADTWYACADSVPDCGKGKDSGVSAASANGQAIAKAQASLDRARGEIQQRRAAGFAARASAAAQAGREAEAESFWVIAAATSPGAPGGWLAQRYGIEGGELSALLDGRAPKAPTESLRVDASRPPTPIEAPAVTGRFAGRESASVYLTLGYMGTTNILNQPDRAAAMVRLRAGGSLVAHTFAPYGFFLHDWVHADLGLGFRTSTSFRTFAASEGESSWAYDLGVGYAIGPGYRSGRFAIIAGIDPQARTLGIGSMAAYDGMIPLMARAELRLGGIAVLDVTGWAFELASNSELRALEVALPISRSNGVLLARIEQFKSQVGVAIDEDTDPTRALAGRQVTTSATFGLGGKF